MKSIPRAGGNSRLPGRKSARQELSPPQEPSGHEVHASVQRADDELQDAHQPLHRDRRRKLNSDQSAMITEKSWQEVKTAWGPTSHNSWPIVLQRTASLDKSVRESGGRMSPSHPVQISIWGKPSTTNTRYLKPELQTILQADGTVNLLLLLEKLETFLPGPFLCHHCDSNFGFLSFVSHIAPIDHRLIHEGEKWPCSFASMGFPCDGHSENVNNDRSGRRYPNTEPLYVMGDDYHYLMGHGLYCPCGRPFRSLQHLAFHVMTHPIHVSSGESGTIKISQFHPPTYGISLFDWCLDTVLLHAHHVDKSTWIYRSAQQVSTKDHIFAEKSREFSVAGDQPYYIWLDRTSARYTDDEDDGAQFSSVATAIYEHLQFCDGIFRPVAIARVKIQSRIFPLLPCPPTAKFMLECINEMIDWPSDDAFYWTSQLATALSNLSKWPNYKPVVGTIADGFTSCLPALALFCLTNLPFYFDCLIQATEVKRLQYTVGTHLFRMFFTAALNCRAVTLEVKPYSIWFRFDSVKLGRAIIQERIAPGQLDVYPYRMFIDCMKIVQKTKNSMMSGHRTLREDKYGNIRGVVNFAATGMFDRLEEGIIRYVVD